MILFSILQNSAHDPACWFGAVGIIHGGVVSELVQHVPKPCLVLIFVPGQLLHCEVDPANARVDLRVHHLPSSADSVKVIQVFPAFFSLHPLLGEG